MLLTDFIRLHEMPFAASNPSRSILPFHSNEILGDVPGTDEAAFGGISLGIRIRSLITRRDNYLMKCRAALPPGHSPNFRSRYNGRRQGRRKGSQSASTARVPLVPWLASKICASSGRNGSQVPSGICGLRCPAFVGCDHRDVTGRQCRAGFVGFEALRPWFDYGAKRPVNVAAGKPGAGQPARTRHTPFSPEPDTSICLSPEPFLAPPAR
jgi:hypothetical protein